MKVEPDPIFVDQIKSNFLLKDADYLDEIKLISKGRPSKYTQRFIEWIMVQARVHENSNKVKAEERIKIEVNYKKLAARLQMNSWLNTAQTGRIKKNLQKAYEIAKQLGYISSCETAIRGITMEKEVFILSPTKFPWTEKYIKKEIV